jgi:hypothetical protein
MMTRSFQETESFEEVSLEVKRKQGAAFPFTYGMYLVHQLLGFDIPEGRLSRSDFEEILGYSLLGNDYETYRSKELENL